MAGAGDTQTLATVSILNEEMLQLKIRVINVVDLFKLQQMRAKRMDCYAESLKKRFNVEIQRKNSGAGAHRARFNASLMDASISVKREDYDDLPDTYVIFITEHDT